MSMKKLLASAIVAAAAVGVTAIAPAEAGKGHRAHHHQHHFKHWKHVYVGGPYDYARHEVRHCNHFYRKWRATGSRYWRSKFYDCRYWW
jgi:hypothetical protein